MRLKTTIGDLAVTVKGRVLKGAPDSPFDSFQTDTRKLADGSFFWALKGENHDAHGLLGPALAERTAGWVAEAGKLGPAGTWPAAVIGVDDTLKALQRLAAWHRRRFGVRLTAITGSNGKSTTKEMLRSILERSGPTCFNQGNLNNHFGLPLSLLELGAEHKYGVFELGASKRGDILEIGSLAAPSVAVITNIAPAHLQYFGDLETVLRTKMELIDCLGPDGTLVYNADDELLRPLRDRNVRKLSFGGAGADVSAHEGREGFDIAYAGRSVRVTLSGDIRHNRFNAAAAAAAAIASGVDLPAIKAGLESYIPPPMRMQRLSVGGSTVVLDAYNANPSSMKAALDAVSGPGFPRPLYLALGDMKELGRHSARYHSELGAGLARMDAERIFLAGTEMKAAAEELSKALAGARTVYAETPQAWAGELRGLIAAGKGTFLLKASRAMKFERLIEGLR